MIKKSDSSLGGIEKKNQYDFDLFDDVEKIRKNEKTENENDIAKTENSAEMGFKNIDDFVTQAAKKDMQYQINTIAQKEYDLSAEEQNQLQLSYFMAAKLQRKIHNEKKKNPYGVDLNKKALAAFVQERVDAMGLNREENNPSSKPRKNDTMKGTSQNKKSKKKSKKNEKGGMTGKAFAWATGGTGLLYFFAS